MWFPLSRKPKLIFTFIGSCRNLALDGKFWPRFLWGCRECADISVTDRYDGTTHKQRALLDRVVRAARRPTGCDLCRTRKIVMDSSQSAYGLNQYTDSYNNNNHEVVLSRHHYRGVFETWEPSGSNMYSCICLVSSVSDKTATIAR